MIHEPVGVYINWAAYDELSDDVPLTEAIAMEQMSHLLRLRRAGVRLDYYMMDAFWYAPDGGYRTWRKPHWPEGPGRWLAACAEGGVKPGLWLSGNTLQQLQPVAAWRDSLNGGKNAMSLFAGGFLPDLMAAMRHWADRGVKMFKIDFMNFAAAPAGIECRMTVGEIERLNFAAFRAALAEFRAAYSDVLILGYNGFEERARFFDGKRYCNHPGQSGTGGLPTKIIDAGWLDVLDSLYCGDPRPADVPAMNFWRAKDVYSDHMVAVYAASDFPLSRIDNAGFMVGTTGTCYYRRTAAWRGMLLLSLARGGWVNTYYGNLDLISDEDARWFARAQGVFFPLQQRREIRAVGGVPGRGEAYGYDAGVGADRVLVAVNPSQGVSPLLLPGDYSGAMRVLFSDAGYGAAVRPTPEGAAIVLGPEQVAVLGVGKYAGEEFDFGVQEDVRIPLASQRMYVAFVAGAGGREAVGTIEVPPGVGKLRVIFRQVDGAGLPRRTSGGSPPKGTTMGKLLTISAEQGGREVGVAIGYDKAIWSGLSWAVGEIDCAGLQAGEAVTIRCGTSESGVTISAEVWHVRYA